MQTLLDLADLATPRVLLRQAVAADAPDMTLVYGELMPLLERIGRGAPAADLARSAIEHEILPPNGSRSRSRTFLARTRHAREVVGVLGYYVGYPAHETLYISQLFLRPRWHGQGLGREIMTELEAHAARAGVREIRLGVDPGNWGALRFWVRAGYDHITTLVDVEEMGPSGPPRFELSKPGAALASIR